jgi:TolB protein
MQRPVGLSTLALLCWSCSEVGSPNPPAIIFDSDRDGSHEIYAFASDGSGARQLTDSEDPELFARLPDWSPDCTEVAFQGNLAATENRDIYVMSADGAAVRRLTRHTASDESPDWSPDGKSIAFASGREDPETIYIIGANGQGLRRLTDGPAFQPAWSPDGTQIAFISGSDANWDVFVIRADGSNLRRLTRTDGVHESGVAWSPDGEALAFDALTDGGWEIFVMGVDGSNVRQLTRNETIDTRPSWSPDGRWIVFHSTRDFGSDGDSQDWQEFEIYVMRSDGTEPQRLTDNVAFDAHPDWCQSSDDPPRPRMK